MNAKPAPFRYRFWTALVLLLALAAAAGVCRWFGQKENRLHQQLVAPVMK